MGKQAPLLEVDPQFLPLGTRVGPWRVTGFRGRGACGTLYQVELLEGTPLYEWAARRNPSEAQVLRVLATLEQREAEKARAVATLERRRRAAFAPAWAAAGAAALLILLLMLVTERKPPGEPRANAGMAAHEDRGVSVGDSAISPAGATPAPEPQGDSSPKLARPLPEKPFPGQLQPPCVPRMEAAIRGACGCRATPP
jgi:hypothetical protein